MVWLFMFSLTILWTSALSYSAGKPVAPVAAPILPPVPKEIPYSHPPKSYEQVYKVPEKPQHYGSYGSSYKVPTAYSPQVSKGQIATGSYGMPTGKPDSIQKCHCYVVPSYEAYPPMGPSPYGGGNGPLAATPGGFNALPPMGSPPMRIASPAARELSPADINNPISANPQQATTIVDQLGVPASSLASLA